MEREDVALVADPNQPHVWPLGRIVSPHPEWDGLVGAVTVHTQQGEYKIPIMKLCLLEEAEA